MKKFAKRAVKALSLFLAAVIVFVALPAVELKATAAGTEFADALYAAATSKQAYNLWATKSAALEKDFPLQMASLNADAEAAGVQVKSLGKESTRLNTMYSIAYKCVTEINNNDITSRVADAYSKGDVHGLMKAYAEAIVIRSYSSMKSLYDFANAYIVVKNKAMGGSHYAYTEALSDDKNTAEGSEVNFFPGSQLVLLILNESSSGIETKEEVLIDLPDGVVRDPDVSTDGTRVLFSMKKNAADDYHLYELELKTRAVRQLTSGEGVSDIEGSYLPNGKIVFQSTRCVQTVDCWKTPVSNLYVCDGDGGNIIRVGYDQVTTSYTSVTTDGRVIYTRWDYNDRNQMFVQGLFQMNPDGTNQTELYGNNSSFPTTLLHAREVTGTSSKYVAISSGHHTYQGGKLVMVDVSKGRDAEEAVKYVFPADGENFRDNEDAQNQGGAIYRYPYAISESQFLVSYAPDGWAGDRKNTPFSIYYMTTDGTKTILCAGTADLPAGQIVPIKNRDLFDRASMVNYAKSTGTYYIGNVYEGESMKGVTMGEAKYLRVVALEYRTAAIGTNNSSNPGIMASGTAFTPVSSANGTWDIKVPLGVVEIEEDGSCMFEVPSEVSLFFQVLDKDYEIIATMRSWSTLQPNEYYSCVGCHEDNNTAPPASATRTKAMERGVQKIVPEDWMTAENGYNSYDPYTDRIGFSYNNVIQPILDKSCIECHNNETISRALVYGSLPYRDLKNADLSKYVTDYTSTEVANFAGTDEIFPINADNWKYTFSKPGANWFEADYDKSSWKTGKASFADGNGNTQWGGGNMDIWISRDFTISAAQANKAVYLRMFHDEDVEIYINGEKVFSAVGYVTKYFVVEINGLKLKTGKNHIAIHCKQTTGGRKIDCGIYVSKTKNASEKQEIDLSGVFSLEGTLLQGDSEKRQFSLSYLVLTQSTKNGSEWKALNTNNDWISFVSCQSPCEVQKAYYAGSSKSKLIDLLKKGHGNLTEAEIRAFECWIDMSIPFAGSYDELNTWSTHNKDYYDRTVAKRELYDKLDRETKDALAG